MAYTIRPLTEPDWPQAKQIYQQGIITGDATYETQAPEVEGLKAKFLAEPRLMAEKNSQVIGWAFASAVSSRCVYGGMAEISIEFQGRGFGRALLSDQVPLSEKLGFWKLQVQIFLKNKSGISLHQ